MSGSDGTPGRKKPLRPKILRQRKDDKILSFRFGSKEGDKYAAKRLKQVKLKYAGKIRTAR